jgi:hypothetical protein
MDVNCKMKEIETMATAMFFPPEGGSFPGSLHDYTISLRNNDGIIQDPSTSLQDAYALLGQLGKKMLRLYLYSAPVSQ